jgi:hypothetical protein
MTRIYFLLCFYLLTFSNHLASQWVHQKTDSLYVASLVAFPQYAYQIQWEFDPSMFGLKKEKELSLSDKEIESLQKKLKKKNDDIQIIKSLYLAYKFNRNAAKENFYLDKLYQILREKFDNSPADVQIALSFAQVLQAYKRPREILLVLNLCLEKNPESQTLLEQTILSNIENGFYGEAEQLIMRSIQIGNYTENLYPFILKFIIEKGRSETDSTQVNVLDRTVLLQLLKLKPDDVFAKICFHYCDLVDLYNKVHTQYFNWLYREHKWQESEITQIRSLDVFFKSLLKSKDRSTHFLALQALVGISSLDRNMNMALAYHNELLKIQANHQLSESILVYGYLFNRNILPALKWLSYEPSGEISLNQIMSKAYLMYEVQNFQELKSYLERSLLFFPNNTDIVEGLIAVLHKKLQFEEACSLFFRWLDVNKEENIQLAEMRIHKRNMLICQLIYNKNKEEVKKLMIEARQDKDEIILKLLERFSVE